MTHTRESRKIAATVIGLGNSLGLVTVAEGVESQTHADMLLWLGCERGQGFLYGRAIPAEGLAAFLAEKAIFGSPASNSPVTEASMPLRLETFPTQRLAQLHAIYDGVPVGLAFLDTNLRYISVNKRLAEMHNLPVANHLGRTVAEALPDWHPKLQPYLQRSLAGESITGIEMSHPDAYHPGQTSTFLVSFQPARDEVEEIIGISLSFADISPRKRAEQALAESEDHYRHTVELNPQIPWTAGPDGMILDVSQRWEKLTGLPKEKSLGQGWIQVVHPADVQQTLTAWHHSIRTGEPTDLEFRIRRTTPGWRWVRSRAAPRRDEQGNIIRWYGTLEDIDDQKCANDALRHSEALLQAVFNAVPVGLIIADAPDGRIVMSNPRADSILRQPVIPTRNIQEYRSIGATDAEGHKIAYRDYPVARAIAYGQITEGMEVLYRHHDGSKSWLSLSAAPVRDTEGKIVGGVAAIQDIDEAKREKQKLFELTNELRKELEAHT